MNKRTLLLLPVMTLPLVLSSCAVKPKPISPMKRHERVTKDYQDMFAGQEAVTHRVTMYQAMARALKYNLDIRLKTLESVLGRKDLKLSNYSMLPQAASQAGYLTRSNINSSNSLNLGTGLPTFGGAPTTSEQVNRGVADLQATWNVLDFGVSYLNSRQKADQYLIAQERKDKMIQNVIRDVRYAYWRALSAQRLRRQVPSLIAQTRTAIRMAKQTSTEKLRPKLDTLRYTQSLYLILRHLTRLQRHLVQAKSELAALMNVKPGSHFHLVRARGSHNPLPKGFPKKLSTLEKIALYNRPELREEDYRKRISYTEVKKSRLRMLPGLQVSGGPNYDSNRFLTNNYWANFGLLSTWNLFNFVSGPAAIRAAKAKFHVSNMRRLALSMAIMTQVDVAYYRYHQARRELALARRLRAVANRIYREVAAQYHAGKSDKLELVRARANRVLESLRCSLDYAQWQNAGGQLLAAIGHNPVQGVNVALSVNQVSEQVKQSLARVKDLTIVLQPPVEKPAVTHTKKMSKGKEVKKVKKIKKVSMKTALKRMRRMMRVARKGIHRAHHNAQRVMAKTKTHKHTTHVKNIKTIKAASMRKA